MTDVITKGKECKAGIKNFFSTGRIREDFLEEMRKISKINEEKG